MKIKFEQDEKLPPNNINVTVSASQLSNDVVELIHQLEQLNAKTTNVLPIQLADHVQMVKISSIIAVEVFNSQLVFYTINHEYHTNGQLNAIITKINDRNFVQIARSAIININHLISLEAGFSGNMTAFLTNQIKLNVSRKYLHDLKERLRME